MPLLTKTDARRAISLVEALCQEALVEDCGLSRRAARQRLDEELGYYRGLKLEGKSLAQIYSRFIRSLANRQGLWSLVFGARANAKAQLALYGEVLLGFRPKRVAATYQMDHQRLCRDLMAARKLSREQLRRQRTHKDALFPKYARGVLDGAHYFSKFKNGAGFSEFVGTWLEDAATVAALPQHLASAGICGFGPALASDFLKELGVKELGKPDVWVSRFMRAAGWIGTGPAAAPAQRIFWEIYQLLGEDYPPIVVDKLFYLAGAGRFAMVSPKYKTRSRLEAFTARLR